MASCGTTPALPVEIIDQIIDEVAYSESPGHDTDSQQILDTSSLKSCALVSRAFNARSRHHIFSTMNLIIDRSAQERAGKLLRTLRTKDTKTPPIQSIIHRLNFLLDFRNSEIVPKVLILTGMTKPFTSARNLLHRSLEAVGLREHNVYQLLDIMDHTNLTHFSLGSRRGIVKWAPQLHNLNDKLLRIVVKPSLRNLHLHNLLDLPDVYIRTMLRSSSLKAVTLSHLRFSREEPSPSPIDHGFQPSLPKIESMELRFTSYKTFLAILRTVEAEETAPILGIYPIYTRFFSHLQTLSVCFPRSMEQKEALWAIMQSAAHTVTTLKIDCLGEIDTASLDPINLSPFKTLKCLDLSLTMVRQDTDVGIPELYLCHLLSSATSLMLLESINLNFTITSGSSSGVFHPSPGWSLLDNALNNPVFVNLKSVVCDVKASIDDGTSPLKDIQMRDTRRVLPIMTASPSVDIRIYLNLIQ